MPCGKLRSTCRSNSAIRRPHFFSGGLRYGGRRNRHRLHSSTVTSGRTSTVRVVTPAQPCLTNAGRRPVAKTRRPPCSRPINITCLAAGPTIQETRFSFPIRLKW